MFPNKNFPQISPFTNWMSVLRLFSGISDSVLTLAIIFGLRSRFCAFQVFSRRLKLLILRIFNLELRVASVFLTLQQQTLLRACRFFMNFNGFVRFDE